MSLIYAAQIKTDDGRIGVYPDGSLNLPKRLTAVPAVDVVSITVEDGQEASKRVTAARVAAVGVFALAIKKKVDATKYIVIETTEDAYVYEISAKRYREARAFEARAMAIVRKGKTAAERAADVEEDEATPTPKVGLGVTPTPPAGQPDTRRWWQKSTGELINERRARKGKAPIDFSAV
jgi:hypothetical protein